jgi:formylglycine-generating enzyme required for sulfatase activity
MTVRSHALAQIYRAAITVIAASACSDTTTACLDTADPAPGDPASPALDAGAPVDASEGPDGDQVDAGGGSDALPPTRVPVDWVRISGGRFMMGPDHNTSPGVPAFAVQVPTFDLMRTEVTIGQFAACVQSGGCRLPEKFVGESPCYGDRPDLRDMPVTCVHWEDAQDYADWVGGGARLPTNSEWEFAARGGAREWEHPWGDAPATCELAVMSEEAGVPGCGRDAPWPPCSRPAGTNPEGVCDLLGNVREWVQDVLGRADDTPRDGTPFLLPGLHGHVARGGCYWTSPEHLSSRYWEGGGGYDQVTGFRLARPVAPESWRKPAN